MVILSEHEGIAKVLGLGPCRNNSSGILLGCNQVRQHKWQKLKLAVVPRRWRELNRGLWVNPTKCLASAGAVVGIVSGIVSTTVSVVGS